MDFKDVNKMTKKERKAHFSRYRNLWNINPTTRREYDKKAKQHKQEKERAKSAYED